MIRTVGRMLLVSAAAVVMLHGRAGAAPALPDESPASREAAIQTKLSERTPRFSILVQTTLDKALNEVLTAHGGIPWTVNANAFAAAQEDRDIVRKTEIDKIDEMTDATRAAILKRLLDKIPSEGGMGTPTYLIRPHSIEITTVGARLAETEGTRAAASAVDGLGGVVAVPPPLAYAAFNDVPLQDALKEMARDTEITIILDARAAAAAKIKVTAELPGVPLDVALELLTDMGDLKVVHIANVYYVTTPKNAERLQQEENQRQPAGTALLTPPRPAAQVAKRLPVDRKAGAPVAQTLVRPLLALATVGAAPTPPPAGAAAAPPPAEAESSMGRILEFQKKLNERIDYELVVPTTLDKALVELLTWHEGIPWTVNDAAFMAAQQDKQVVKKTEIDKIDKMTGVTRAAVLKKLLANIPNGGGKESPTYVLRPDSLEITTREAVEQEFYTGRYEHHLPPLAYASFKETPLREALVELARTTQKSVVLDPKAAEESKSKVTAEFLGAPADTAVQVLADMTGLQLVRLESVYYVTTPANAEVLRKEINRRRLELQKILGDGDTDPLNLPLIP